jgi:hypothetical protein
MRLVRSGDLFVNRRHGIALAARGRVDRMTLTNNTIAQPPKIVGPSRSMNCGSEATANRTATHQKTSTRAKLSLRSLAEMFLVRGMVFSYEAARDWEAKLTPVLAEAAAPA